MGLRRVARSLTARCASTYTRRKPSPSLALDEAERPSAAPAGPPRPFPPAKGLEMTDATARELFAIDQRISLLIATDSPELNQLFVRRNKILKELN
jgi:hypothetical protein